MTDSAPAPSKRTLKRKQMNREREDEGGEAPLHWTSSDISKLISLVAQTTELYDMSNPEYSIRESVDAAWANISEHLGKTVKDCRDRWYNLRTVYRRQLRDYHITLNKTGHKKPPRWVWSTAMSFLLPFLRLTGKKPVIELAGGSQESQKCFDEVMTPNIKFENIEFEEEDFSSTSDNKRFCLGEQSPDPLTVRHNLQLWDQSPSSIPSDVDEMFLRSLLPDMKSLNARNKALFKMKVQQVMFDCMYPDDGEDVEKHEIDE